LKSWSLTKRQRRPTDLQGPCTLCSCLARPRPVLESQRLPWRTGAADGLPGAAALPALAQARPVHQARQPPDVHGHEQRPWEITHCLLPRWAFCDDAAEGVRCSQDAEGKAGLLRTVPAGGSGRRRWKPRSSARVHSAGQRPTAGAAVRLAHGGTGVPSSVPDDEWQLRRHVP